MTEAIPSLITSENDAVSKAEEGLKIDMHCRIEDKIAYFKCLPKITGLDKRDEKTLYKCFSVMKSQVYSSEGMFKTWWTTPDRLPHKKLWLWDSIFHSFGNRYIFIDLAYQSIQAVLATQTKDGFIPHMAALPEERSNITQPPVIAWGLYDLYHYSCIDFSCFMANEARFMAKIARVLSLQEEQEFWSGLFENIKNAINERLWDEKDKFYYDRILSNGEFKKVKAVSSFLPLFAGVCEMYHAEFLVKHLMDKNSFCVEFPVPSISVDDAAFGTDMWRGPVWINYNYMLIKGLREYGYIELADEISEKTINTIAFWYEHDGTVYEFYDAMNRISPRKLNRKGPCIEPYDFRIRYQSIRDYGWTCTLFADLIMEKSLNDQNRKMK